MPKFQPTLSEQKLPLVEHARRGWIDCTYLTHPCRTTIPTARPLQQQRQPIQVSHWTGAEKVVPVCSLRNALQARHSPHQQRGFDETVPATTERTSGVADALRRPLACGVRCAARSVSPHPFSARHSPGKSNKTSVPARSWRSLVHTFPPLSALDEAAPHVRRFAYPWLKDLRLKRDVLRPSATVWLPRVE